MGWVQVVGFDVSKMGTEPGMCEKNCRLGYGLPARCASAKEDMEFNRNNGTLHPMSELPDNVAVPVFVDTASPYEHIEVSDHGTFYSDGKRVSNPYSQKFFGWGEFCAKARVVEYVKEPEPTPPAPEPTPEPSEGFKVGDIVVPTRLVDYNGTPLKQYDDTYTITQINGDRAVLSAPRGDKMVVWAAMNTNDIRKA